ncbi:hypothetical protein KR222_006854, partial [Zaprionus bogoriensis]
VMKASISVILVGLLACSQALDADSEWQSFKVNYQKIYNSPALDKLRRSIFLSNKRIIEAHNERWAQGDESFEMGINQFTDMLDGELSDKAYTDLIEVDEAETISEIPAAVNWTAEGAVSPEVSQGSYRNDWAFAVAGVVESRQFISKKTMTILSKQNLIDCCQDKKRLPNPIPYALSCIEQLGGINTEADNPYHGRTGQCHFDRTKIGAKIRKIYQVRERNETLLAYSVAKGPVAAKISSIAVRYYTHGIFKSGLCLRFGYTNPYSVLIVGYGTDEHHGDYWILKTSMGPSWGEGGYMRLGRNLNNLCGITNSAYYPVV